MKTRKAPLATMLVTTFLTLFVAVTAFALPITPVSYDMPNGFRTPTYEYVDNTYTVAGNISSASTLSGGAGDLTDGFVSLQNYGMAEAPAGPGPYVGWNINPTIIFHFSSDVDLDSLTLFLDDPNGTLGCSRYGVCLPGSVTLTMGGVEIRRDVFDPSTAKPLPVTLSDLGLNGNTLELTLNRKNSGFVFLSEVTFDGTYAETLSVARISGETTGAPVPEPGTLVLLGAGLFGLAVYSKRRMSRS